MGKIKRAAVLMIVPALLLSMTACSKRSQSIYTDDETSITSESDELFTVTSETEATTDASSQADSESDVTSILSNIPGSSSKITNTTSSAKSSNSTIPAPASSANTNTAAGEAYGKYSGNVTNQSLVTQVGDWIYYSNSSDGGALYKIRTDGSKKTKLTSKPAVNIQVCGDWIIFTNGNLRKIKTDGTQEQNIESDYIFYYAIVSDTIYYYTEILHKTSTLPLRLDWVKVDGSSSGTVDNFVSNRIARMFSAKCWLYFYVYTHPPEVVKRVKTGTFTEESLVASSSAQSINDIGYMAVQNDWVYYSVRPSSSVFRCKPDGSQNSQIISNCQYGCFNTDGISLYYINSDDGQLWRAGIDGSNPKGITNYSLGKYDTLERINLTDNDVYVALDNDFPFHRSMYRINKSTLNQELVN